MQRSARNLAILQGPIRPAYKTSTRASISISAVQNPLLRRRCWNRLGIPCPIRRLSEILASRAALLHSSPGLGMHRTTFAWLSRRCRPVGKLASFCRVVKLTSNSGDSSCAPSARPGADDGSIILLSYRFSTMHVSMAWLLLGFTCPQ